MPHSSSDSKPSSSRGLNPSAFTHALLEASSFKAIVGTLEGLAQHNLQSMRIALFWSIHPGPITQDQLRCAPRRARQWADPELAHQSQAAHAPRQSAANVDGCLLRSWPLEMRGAGSAIIQVEVATGDLNAIDSDPTLSEGLELLARRVSSMLQARHLQASLRRFEKSERLQRALFAIADLAGSQHEQHEVLRQMHHVVGELIYARNFFIVLYDAGRKMLRFAYFADTQDTDVPDPDVDLPEE